MLQPCLPFYTLAWCLPWNIAFQVQEFGKDSDQRHFIQKNQNSSQVQKKENLYHVVSDNSSYKINPIWHCKETETQEVYNIKFHSNVVILDVPNTQDDNALWHHIKQEQWRAEGGADGATAPGIHPGGIQGASFGLKKVVCGRFVPGLCVPDHSSRGLFVPHTYKNFI